MALAICDRGQWHTSMLGRAIAPIDRRTLRMIVFAAAAGILCFFAFGATGVRAQDKQAQPCRTAADDAELAKLEIELDSLQIHKVIETSMKAAKEKDLADLKEGKPVLGSHGIVGPQAIDRLTKRIEELDAELKENAARTEVVKARIAVLKALKPCPPESKTPPPKNDGPGTTPPPAHPCRTPEDDKTIAALKVKKALYQAELKVLNNWIDSLGRRYAALKKEGDKPVELEATDKQITEFGRQRNVLEGDIRGLQIRIDALQALKPCGEEGKTPATPGTGTGPGTKHPKKAVKHGKHAVSEDSPLYMQNYTPPAKTTTRHRSGSGDYSNAPPEEPKDETNDKPPGDNEPEIPIPH